MSRTWLNMRAADLGREIGAGRINPIDLTELLLDTIAKHPLADRIFARTTPARARAEAMAAARQGGTFRMQKGYDHSYFFVSTFMEEHIAFHAAALHA